MDKTPSISVIMAAYNAESFIGEAMDSVLAQTWQDYELLVVDDCSTDGTAALVRQYAARDPRVKLIQNEQNAGVSRSRYLGLERARGDWIAVLDSDDAWAPEKLEKQMALQRKTGAQLLYTGSRFMDHLGNSLDWVMKVPEQVRYQQLLKRNIISNSSALCKKALYQSFYAIGDGMHEDFALWLRILKSGVTAYGINEPLLTYRLYAKSKSGNKLRSARMNWNTYRYLGLNWIQAARFMLHYGINGLKKYSNLRR